MLFNLEKKSPLAVGVAFIPASGYCGNKREGWGQAGRMSNFIHRPPTHNPPCSRHFHPVWHISCHSLPLRLAFRSRVIIIHRVRSPHQMLPLQHGSKQPCTQAIGFYNKLITLYQHGLGVSFPHASNIFMDRTHVWLQHCRKKLINSLLGEMIGMYRNKFIILYK